MTNSYSVPYIYPLVQSTCKKGDLPGITVKVPGSKSITNRAMLLAAMAEGQTTLSGALFSDDSRYLVQCLKDLGYPVSDLEEKEQIRITGFGKKIPRSQASVYVGSAGTAARFLAAMLGSSHGTYLVDASEQMKKRPMAPLLESLTALGAEIHFQEGEDHLPFTILGHGFQKNHLTVNIDQSSQFLSALLISSVCAGEDITLQAEGHHGMSYIEITKKMMSQFGVDVQTPSPGVYRIPAGSSYQSMDYAIEPDVSAASYFYAMATLLGCSVLVKGVHESSMQGDLTFLYLLKELGATLTDTPEGILLTGPTNGIYPGITADMSSCSDQAITMAALAVFATSPTKITGIGHIRFQESNRLEAICKELHRMGIHTEETEDSIVIYPGSPLPTSIRTYDDHRMAMGFSLIGLRVPGIVIEDPDCCRKTFETYFDVLSTAVSQLVNK